MATESITKLCKRCNQIKPLSEFYVQVKSKDGHRPWCKPCWAQWQREYQQTEKGRQAMKRGMSKYHRTQKYKESRKRYKNSAKGKESRERYENSAKGIAYYTAYYKSEKNKERCRKYFQTKMGRIVKRRAAAKQRRIHRNRVLARQRIWWKVKSGQLPRPDTLQCHFCGHKAIQYHHYLGYEPEQWLNVVPSCRKCDKEQHQLVRASNHPFSSSS